MSPEFKEIVLNQEPQLIDIPDTLRAIESSVAFGCQVALEVDARHLSCPLPLLKARQGLRELAVGDVLRVLATDSGSLKDFVSFAELTGQRLDAFAMDAGVYCYLIRKA